MKLAWILWLSHVLPQPAADSLCLSTTVFLEARDQTVRGQEAVAEVALRRRDSGLWGDNLCEVVTARHQFAPSLVSPDTNLPNESRLGHGRRRGACLAAQLGPARAPAQGNRAGREPLRRDRPRLSGLGQCLPGGDHRRPHLLQGAETQASQVVTQRFMAAVEAGAARHP